MTLRAVRFNKTILVALMREGKNHVIRDTVAAGLKFRVGPKRSVFLFEKRISGIKGAPITITIGAFPMVTIEQARQLARKLANLCERGIDPRKHRDEQDSRVIPLNLAIEKFFELKNDIAKRTIKDYQSIINAYFVKSWMDVDIRTISAEMLVEQFYVVRLRAQKRCWDYLKVFNNIWNTCAPYFRDKNQNRLLVHNPIPEARNMLKSIPRHQPKRLVIPENELGKFVVTLEGLRKSDRPLEQHEGDTVPWGTARMSEMCLLALFTAFRFAEVQHLKWEYVDLDHGIIRLPGKVKDGSDFDGTKNHKDHWIPLSSYPWDLLREIHRTSDLRSAYVFSRQRDVSLPIGRHERAFRFISKKAGFHYSPHASRRTFASVANEAGLGFLTVKRMLNHSYVGGVTGGYIVPGFNPAKERENFQKVCDYILDRRAEYLGIQSRDHGTDDIREAVVKIRRYAKELNVDLIEVLEVLKSEECRTVA